MASCMPLCKPYGRLVLDPLLGVGFGGEIWHLCRSAVVPSHLHVPTIAAFEGMGFEMNWRGTECHVRNMKRGAADR